MIVPKWGRTNRKTNQKFMGCDHKPDRVKQIEVMLKQGMRPTEIAEALGIARSTLSEVMARSGLQKS